MFSDLACRLTAASGADSGLDAAVAQAYATPPAAYTASVSECRRLVEHVRPKARLHLGYGASGVFPYAAVVDGETRSQAEGPTVPLAILRALVAMSAASPA